ncbi:YadA C-terminal domain-containing protein [Vibrio ezurae]|uniref:Trimeric autotransporter adhesin YadA-like C-terminal membrane anchor domain-containing protein n=1 Tax=Vibrio ezurae NBRC 102218 TaxID=1219080 RepID=U3AHS6_9VIBR|nr:YadA C-terminal domain-containing protein [Vibrio ezurae]GAD79476.1 hypothetical protein VEZ01S_16_00250 [Vibrio ezurae NBRC 102218]
MKRFTTALLTLSVSLVSVNALADQTLEQQVATNHAMTTATFQSVYNNNQWLVSLQADAQDKTDCLNAHEAQLQGNTQRSTHNEKRVQSVEHTTVANAKGVSQNRARLKRHDEQLADVKNHATHAETMAQQNHAMAQQNSEKVAQNSADLQNLRRDFEQMAKNVEGAYAESAAFAGLVNPYGVGKFSVTAAVGYHGDAQAVAVGVGERFTENFTAKLGGAYDTATESMSAYAGVGYEF